MPLKLKQKQITVQVAELTLELDQTLTRLLTGAAEEKNVEPDIYVLALIQEHFFPETTESTDSTESANQMSEKPTAAKTVRATNSSPLISPRSTGAAGSSANSTKSSPPTSIPKGSKPKYLGKLSELAAFGDEGIDIALELKNQGWISMEQYEAVLNGELPKGKPAAIGVDARNYIIEQLTKADSGVGVAGGETGQAAGNG